MPQDVDGVVDVTIDVTMVGAQGLEPRTPSV